MTKQGLKAVDMLAPEHRQRGFVFPVVASTPSSGTSRGPKDESRQMGILKRRELERKFPPTDFYVLIERGKIIC